MDSHDPRRTRVDARGFGSGTGGAAEEVVTSQQNGDAALGRARSDQVQLAVAVHVAQGERPAAGLAGDRGGGRSQGKAALPVPQEQHHTATGERQVSMPIAVQVSGDHLPTQAACIDRRPGRWLEAALAVAQQDGDEADVVVGGCEVQNAVGVEIVEEHKERPWQSANG